MKANIFISGRITKGETLVDVIRQFKSYEDPTEVVVEIKSNGGNKDEGDAVHDYLKNLEIPVTTKTGKAYSIAAKIFAAGDTRIVENTEKPIMIHFARAKTEGTAEQLEIVAAELREIENDFIEFYSEHLAIDEDTVRNLLDNETFVSGSEAVELGFATELEKAAEIVAELNIENSNINKMTKKKDKKGFFKKLIADINAYLADEEGTEVVAELTLQDSNGTDVVFPDLESDSTPKVGDKATIDGAAIPDGSYIMPSLEDATVVFVDGEVSEIVPKEEETETEAETETVAEEIKEVITYSVQAASTSFEEGETLMLEPWDESGEPYAASAGEWKLASGKSIVTDASGVIVKVTENTSLSTETETETETEASFEDLLEKVTDKVSKKVKAEVSAEFETKLANKDKEIKALKAKTGSKEFTAEVKEVPEGGKKEKGASRFLKAAKNL